MLIKKTLRTMRSNLKAYLACVLLIAIGVMMYTAMHTAVGRLEQSKLHYYKENQMADIFIKAASMPGNVKDRLEKLAGIRAVSMRLAVEGRVFTPEDDKIITLQMISFGPEDSSPINQIDFSAPGFPGENEIFISEDFATANNLNPGDTLSVIINGALHELQFAGTAASPEFVYIIKDEMDILPDPETFGIGFMAEEPMAHLLEQRGVYNEANLLLEPGYTFDDVKEALEDILQPYGVKEIIPQKDQLSYAMLEGEIQGIQSMAGAIPILFLGMAMLVLYLMLKRLVEQERSQIGALKAMGYSNPQLLKGYLVYGLVIGGAGSLIGVISGYYLAGLLSELYSEFFKLPETTQSAATQPMLTSILLALSFSISGAVLGASGVLHLHPAEAMRPPAPKTVQKDFLSYFPFVKILLTSGGHMAIRNLWRSKVKSCFIITSVMFSFSMLSFMASYDSMIDGMIIDHFTKIKHYDLKIQFRRPIASEAGLFSIQTLEGVQSAHPLLETGVELIHRHRKTGIVITGIPSNGELYRIYDSDQQANIPIPGAGGIVLSHMLAEQLEAREGDVIYISSPDLDKDEPVLVEAVVTQHLGSSSYMEKDALAEIFQLPGLATSVVLKAENSANIKRYLADGKNIAMIEDKQSTAIRYSGFMRSYQGMIVALEVMSAVIAFAMIYNTAVISLSERKREYATLRVLGMDENEVAEIMSFEYWILSAIGMAFGVPFTYFLKTLVASIMEFDMFSFPTYTPMSAYVAGAAGCAAAVFFANRSAKKNIASLDMVDVLKERE